MLEKSYLSQRKQSTSCLKAFRLSLAGYNKYSEILLS